MPPATTNKQPSTKTIHSVKSPYTEPAWPVISSHLETSILESLISVLAPIGEHRQTQTLKLQRKKKRKRKNRYGSPHNESVRDKKEEARENWRHVTSKPELDIKEHLTIGFNSTVRHLEDVSQKLRTCQSLSESETLRPARLFAIFVCASLLPPIMKAPLPLLAATASALYPQDEQIRLVPISQPGAARLATSLKQRMVSILGVFSSASGVEDLRQLVQANVAPMDISWIREATSQKYKPVCVQSEEVAVSRAKSKDQRRKDSADGTIG